MCVLRRMSLWTVCLSRLVKWPLSRARGCGGNARLECAFPPFFFCVCVCVCLFISRLTALPPRSQISFPHRPVSKARRVFTGCKVVTQKPYLAAETSELESSVAALLDIFYEESGRRLASSLSADVLTQPPVDDLEWLLEPQFDRPRSSLDVPSDFSPVKSPPPPVEDLGFLFEENTPPSHFTRS